MPSWSAIVAHLWRNPWSVRLSSALSAWAVEPLLLAENFPAEAVGSYTVPSG
jgi:hypothetical protein